VYVVRQGDTLSGIASRFGVPLEQLQAANPAVDPRFLTVGAALIIPTGGEDPASVLPTPTPPALQLAAPSCFSSAEGALTCFVPAGNPGPLGLENVAARVSLVDASGAVVASETALLPLNLLPPGQSLPLVASFSPPVPPWAHAEIQLLSALPVADSGERYVPVEVGDSRVAISPDGLSAVVSGALALSAGSESAAEVWLAALALDSEGRVVGVRRWESATPLLAGGSLEFTLNLYSLSGRIAAVALYAEARPE
jgi:LysM repeat protein